MPPVRDQAASPQVGQHIAGDRLAADARQGRQLLVCQPHHPLAVSRRQMREDIGHVGARVGQRAQVVGVLDTLAGRGEGAQGHGRIRQEERGERVTRDAVDDGFVDQRLGDRRRTEGGVEARQAADLPGVEQGDGHLLAAIKVAIQAHDARREDEDGLDRVVGLPEGVATTKNLAAAGRREGGEGFLRDLAEEVDAAQRRDRDLPPINHVLYW